MTQIGSDNKIPVNRHLKKSVKIWGRFFVSTEDTDWLRQQNSSKQTSQKISENLWKNFLSTEDTDWLRQQNSSKQTSQKISENLGKILCFHRGHRLAPFIKFQVNIYLKKSVKIWGRFFVSTEDTEWYR